MDAACGHKESVNAMVHAEVKRAATCTTRGITEYTAEVFFNPMAYSGKGNVVTVRDTKEISDILGIRYALPAEKQ